MRGSTELAAVLLALLAACSSVPAQPDARDGRDGAQDVAEDLGPGGPGADPVTELHRLANGCFALWSASLERHVVRSGDGYATGAGSLARATPFFLKPSGPGTYLLHDPDGAHLARTDDGGVTAAPAPGEAADWAIEAGAEGEVRLSAVTTGERLLAPAPGPLALAAADDDRDGTRFALVPASGCREFPEVEINATGEPFRGSKGKPVLGFADSHVHVSAYDAFGGAFYGAPFHRFGVTVALGDCAVRHGENGSRDLLGGLLSMSTGHETQGWPSYASWPARDALTHHQTYYRWIERAWRAGLRLMVTHLVENQTLCRIVAGEDLAPCNEMVSAKAQVAQLRELEAYVDAQLGGPGRGWFRLVTDPAEARQVIEDGKLAVVLGIETSHLFDCALVDGVPQCDEALIDRHLGELWDLGVRAYFPVHEFDNALGGNGIFLAALEAANRADTGRDWEKVPCPDIPYLYQAGARFPEIDPETYFCNARTITELGRYAIARLMERRAIIEIDHMELAMKDEVLDIAEAQAPPYPLVSSHGGHGGISEEQARRIFAAGGLIYPYKGNGTQYVNALERTRPLADERFYFGLGFGADNNGLGTQAAPRGEAAARPVVYPFTLFEGPGFGPEFAGVAPVTFDRQRTGERVYDTDQDGLAHYGLVADFVEEVRIEGGEEAIRQLFRSAEAYLQMWERVMAR